jgi:hypothetical protein
MPLRGMSCDCVQCLFYALMRLVSHAPVLCCRGTPVSMVCWSVAGPCDRCQAWSHSCGCAVSRCHSRCSWSSRRPDPGPRPDPRPRCGGSKAGSAFVHGPHREGCQARYRCHPSHRCTSRDCCTSGVCPCIVPSMGRCTPHAVFHHRVPSMGSIACLPCSLSHLPSRPSSPPASCVCHVAVA